MLRLGPWFGYSLSAGGLVLLALGAASGSLRGEDKPVRYMASSNPWAKHYTPSASAVSGKAPVYFRYCDEARRAGAAPLHRGQPGYAAHLDRDGDGVACEPYRGRR